MTECGESKEAVTFALAQALLLADGKLMLNKVSQNAATRAEIIAAFKEAQKLVRAED